MSDKHPGQIMLDHIRAEALVHANELRCAGLRVPGSDTARLVEIFEDAAFLVDLIATDADCCMRLCARLARARATRG